MWAKIIKSFSIMFIVLFNICVVKNGISFLNNTAEFLFILQSWTPCQVLYTNYYGRNESLFTRGF